MIASALTEKYETTKSTVGFIKKKRKKVSTGNYTVVHFTTIIIQINGKRVT